MRLNLSVPLQTFVYRKYGRQKRMLLVSFEIVKSRVGTWLGKSGACGRTNGFAPFLLIIRVFALGSSLGTLSPLSRRSLSPKMLAEGQSTEGLALPEGRVHDRYSHRLRAFWKLRILLASFVSSKDMQAYDPAIGYLHSIRRSVAALPGRRCRRTFVQCQTWVL